MGSSTLHACNDDAAVAREHLLFLYYVCSDMPRAKLLASGWCTACTVLTVVCALQKVKL